MLDVLTSALELVGMLLLAAAVSWAVATAVPVGVAWPVGLGVAGVCLLLVAVIIERRAGRP